MFRGRFTLCLSEAIFRECQLVRRELQVVRSEEERDLIAAFTSGKHLLYVNSPPAVNVVSADPGDNKFVACALALEADYIVSGDSDLMDLGSYMGIPVVTVR